MAQMWLRNDAERSLALLHGRQQERPMRRFIETGLDFDGISAYGLGITSQKYHAADTAHAAARNLFLVGAYGDAYAYLDQAVALSDEWSARQADFLGWQIRTAFRLSDPDPHQIAERIFALARIAPLISSALVDQHIVDVYVESRRWAKVPSMRAAREQLYDIMPRHVQDSLPR